MQEIDPAGDDLARLLFRLELEHGYVVSSETYPFISLARARRIARGAEFEILWWTTKEPPFAAWRMISKDHD